MTSKLKSALQYRSRSNQYAIALRKERDYWKKHSHDLEETILGLLNDLKAYQSVH